jgi:hypothetical protein
MQRARQSKESKKYPAYQIFWSRFDEIYAANAKDQRGNVMQQQKRPNC